MSKFPQIIIGLIMFVATINVTIAQNIKILDSLGNIMNNQLITVTYFDLNTTHSVYLGVKNTDTSSPSKDVKLRRYETNVLSNTANFFCWSLCYAPVDAGVKTVWTDNGFVTMVKDSVYKKLNAYYTPNGNAGVSIFRYVLFDNNNPKDTAFVDIAFDIQVGISVFAINKNPLTFYPNPVSNFLTIDNADNANKMFLLNNILGMKVKEFYIPANTKTTVSIDALPEGIFFMKYYDSDNKLAVKKIVKKN